MKYKVGDRVVISIPELKGKIAVIKRVFQCHYDLDVLGSSELFPVFWTDECIEGLAEEYSQTDKKEVYKKYPKTYEECAKVLLDRASSRNDIGYKGDLLVSLQKLLVCRDAYWKLYGEEMGLRKPWKPSNDPTYDIIRQYGKVRTCNFIGRCTLLEFPTPEMRDVFKKNFKVEIESCKEFL